jgi:hypothetical protein
VIAGPIDVFDKVRGIWHLPRSLERSQGSGPNFYWLSAQARQVCRSDTDFERVSMRIFQIQHCALAARYIQVRRSSLHNNGGEPVPTAVYSDNTSTQCLR